MIWIEFRLILDIEDLLKNQTSGVFASAMGLATNAEPQWGLGSAGATLVLLGEVCRCVHVSAEADSLL